jgi:hypothetical protein
LWVHLSFYVSVHSAKLLTFCITSYAFPTILPSTFPLYVPPLPFNSQSFRLNKILQWRKEIYLDIVIFCFMLQCVVTYSSTYVLVALSIDRYDAVTHPMNFSGSCKSISKLYCSQSTDNTQVRFNTYTTFILLSKATRPTFLCISSHPTKIIHYFRNIPEFFRKY